MKNLLFTSFIVLAGCNSSFLGKKTDSFSEKLSLMDREMSQQSGKIEVLEHENMKIKRELELIKSSFETRFEKLKLKEFNISQKESSSQESNNPTELNNLGFVEENN